MDRALTRGMEASMRLRLHQRVNLQSNYMFTESEQQSGELAGQPLVNTPRHNAVLRYMATKKLNLWLQRG